MVSFEKLLDNAFDVIESSINMNSSAFSGLLDVSPELMQSALEAGCKSIEEIKEYLDID
jgi:hypothetical protein